MDVIRRSLLQAIPMLAAATALASDTPALSSFVKPYSDLPVKKLGLSESRAILDGITHSGDHIEVHETTLAADDSPHPPHRHVHDELFLLIKGKVGITIEGTTTVIGPGSAAFIHSNEMHGVINAGIEPAQYFVIAIGL